MRQHEGNVDGPRRMDHLSDAQERGCAMSTVLRPGSIGSLVNGTHDSLRKSSFIASIYESRGPSPEIGLCLFDTMGPGKFVIAQISDTRNYLKTLNKVSVHAPSQILLADSSMQHEAKSRLVLALEDNLDCASLSPAPRGWFNESDGLEFCRKMSFQDEIDATLLVLESKFYALCALSALANFLHSSYRIRFAPGSIKIQYDSPEGSMSVDSETVRNLEIVQSNSTRNTHSLYSVLNKTKTVMASRLLKNNLLQPITDPTLLQRRLEAVEELMSNPEASQALKIALSNIKSCDVERIVGSIVVRSTEQDPRKCENRILAMLALKNFLQSLENVSAALLPCTSTLLRRVAELCNGSQLDSIQAHIEDTLQDFDTGPSLQAQLPRNAKLIAIKPKCNALLDVGVSGQTAEERKKVLTLQARESYSDIINDMTDLVTSLNAQCGFEMELIQRNGYCLSARVDACPLPLPAIFSNISIRGGKYFFTCLDLKMREQRARDAMSEILLISDRVLEALCDDVTADIAALHKTSEAIALVDLLHTFAEVAVERRYCQPEFADTLALYNARHPIVEVTGAGRKFVPNSTFADAATNFQLITGANMAGKTTYLRQIAMNILMAQIGSCVPAQYCSIRLSDCLLSRLGCDDQNASNLSNFAVEMRSMSFILSAATPRSIILVDELGRATSTIDGVAIGVAIAERLLTFGCTVFFVTHLKELKAALLQYPDTISLRISAPFHTNGPDEISVAHTVHEDTGEIEGNAIEIARLAGFPEETLLDAQHFASMLTEAKTTSASRTKSLAARRRLLTQLQRDLRNVVEDGQGNKTAIKLRQIQRGFITNMLRGAGIKS